MADDANVNQRIVVRLRRDQLDEARVLEDYDKRSEMRGSADHDYIRLLILLGHSLMTMMSSAGIASIGAQSVALSANESHNTGKEPKPDHSHNESHAVNGALAENGKAEPAKVVGAAIRHMAGVFSGAVKAS